MAQVTAAMVKEFRDKTQAGMMEAKKFLTDADGDFDTALRSFREKNAKREIKEGRTSAEGVVEAFVREHNRLGVLIELNSETDFVARNEEFIALARDMARHAAENPGATTVDELLDATHTETSQPARLRVQEVFGKMRENILLSRFASYQTEDGTVDAYVHKTGAAGAKIGVLVELSGQGEDIKGLAREVAMHIASAKPKYLKKEDVPAAKVDEEREIVRASTLNDPKNASKPENILEKIIEGGLSNFFKTNVLLDQAYIRDPKMTVSQLLKGKSEVRRFVRFEVGEAS